MALCWQLRLGKKGFRITSPHTQANCARNAPIILAMRGILFPLAAGNTVIFKSSELSPRTHYLLASMFVEAGLPPGALNVIGSTREDGPEITNALIAQRDVRKINFTGSTAVGRKIAAKAGEHLKPLMLELGGKAPFIVFEDADVERAAEAAVFAGYLHVCIHLLFPLPFIPP